MYLATKFGSAAEAHRLYGHIAQVGLTESIEFRFDGIEVTPSTVHAHRLIRFAEPHGRADDIVEALFRAYFMAGRDIGDPAVLAAVAEETGLGRDAAAEYLAGEEDIEAVRAEDMHGRQLGIEGVPYFIVDGRYALSGAQEPEAFHSLFDVVTESFRNTAAAD